MIFKPKCEADYNYKYPIKAELYGEEIMVRKMGKEEMPDDGIDYYCAANATIFFEGEKQGGEFKILE